MSAQVFFEGLLGPFYALVGSTFDPVNHFGQFILLVLVALVLLCTLIKLFFNH